VTQVVGSTVNWEVPQRWRVGDTAAGGGTELPRQDIKRLAAAARRTRPPRPHRAANERACARRAHV